LKQITIRDLRRLASATSLREAMPCRITSDGEVIGVLVPALDYDVRQRKIDELAMSHDVRQATRTTTKSDKLTELPLSKKRQASGRLSDS